ncbi:signal peptide peptidase SppA [Parabacteroides sp. PF5-9]|uniref:signal peptide peptidase SppA n=1 Tax=Parabacteroides sp. PF5-9 TaxID=1742404 RepID=UPI00247368CA|nr:signal peptide peptidase SppA [Parabacteroides sp. PF5-9]MDH6358389.1 protease-4 [Parabacteroides sp. PF5-9]
MKQFFKMMFASTLGVFVAAGIFMLLFFFILVSMMGSIGSSPAYIPKANTVYKIKLDGSLTDNTTNDPLALLFFNIETPPSLKELLEAIRIAKENEHIAGIYLEAGSMTTGSANWEALRRALIDFKESGKFIVAYGDYYSQGNYYLCSVADKIFLNPQGMLEIAGMASQTIFYKGILEKAGVHMEVFRVGTYKGYVEAYIQDKLSDANREQIQSYMGTIWKNVTQGIAESRKISVNDVTHFAESGLALSAPEKAVECGLINELKYKDEVEKYIQEIAGQTDRKLRTASTDKIVHIKTSKKVKTDQIAVVYAEGEIMQESAESIYINENIISEKLITELNKQKRDEKVKAIVLRVNSPGGSAFLSEQIWHEIIEIKKEKPVVISMGSTAASGGYYISSAADKIVAEANTITGSIGIFGMFPNTTGLFQKLGITTEVVKTNKYADIGDMSRPLRDDEKQLIQAHVERGYDLFLRRCAEGRGMSKEAINEVAQGRVWTGEQAKELGLVDELGGIDKAISIAAELANISDYSINHISGSSDLFQDFFEKQLEEIKTTVVKSALGNEFEYWKTIKLIQASSGIQARLPYDMQPL